jgi:ribosomal protein L16/L10AE
MEKLISMIDEAKINTLTVMIMEVPCCSGLLMLAKEALSRAKRKVPLKCIVVGIKGEILSEEWITL